MSDIVERLRGMASEFQNLCEFGDTRGIICEDDFLSCRMAADEIERLRQCVEDANEHRTELLKLIDNQHDLLRRVGTKDLIDK